jgi:hypothetical protein
LGQDGDRDLEKISRVLCERVGGRLAFLDGQSGTDPTESLCKALMVNPSGYANRKARNHGADYGSKRLSDDHLFTLIRELQARTKGAYGSPRTYDELKDARHPVGKRRFKATTDSKQSLPIAPIPLDRQVHAQCAQCGLVG